MKKFIYFVSKSERAFARVGHPEGLGTLMRRAH
jgi:hypothetical protein